MKKFLIIVSILSVALGQVPTKYGNSVMEHRAKMDALMDVTDRKYADHNGNRVLCRIYNYGMIGDLSNNVSGVYPYGTSHSYFYEFTPVIAASVIDENGYRVHIVSDGPKGLSDNSPEGYQWGFEPLTGYANPNQEILALTSNEDSWPESWPDKDDDWNGFWNGQYGKYVRADQETFYVMDDYYNDEFDYYPDSTDAGQPERRSGLGVELQVRGYQWNHPAAEDIIIFTYWIENVGTSTLDSVIFGMYGDADVGGPSSFSDDDAWFDIDNDIVYQWDHDGWSTDYGGFDPVYFGWSFLESPGNPNDGIDNDGDGMVDESQFDGIDNDADWLAERDDIGADGLGEYHYEYPGPDADGTEGNGIPDLGEPNFEITDNDESDQIGLTSFYSAPYPSIQPHNDEVMWSQLQPGQFDVPSQNIDQTYLYGSAFISLDPGEQKKFAVAMVFGNDFDDILRNTVTMQNIYDNDYNFAKPPIKPTVNVTSGNKKVILSWDSKAENSLDPIYGRDFEGYRIYRSTDPGFIDAYVVTDTYGNITFKKPLAVFDIADSLKGPHPIGYNGVQFDMGTDSGLEYLYVDSNLINGQKYYYAVTAFDKGYDLDFYDLGFSEAENLLPIAPSECSIIVDLDRKGYVVNLSENAGIALPTAPVAGYIPPNTNEDGSSIVVHEAGSSTGIIELETIIFEDIPDNKTYTIEFEENETEPKIQYNIRDEEEKIENVVFLGGIASLEYSNIDSVSFVLTNEDGSVEYSDTVDFSADYESGILAIDSLSIISEGVQYAASYKYYPIYQSKYLNGENDNKIFDGMQVKLTNAPLGVNNDQSGFIIGNSNYAWEIVASRVFPADFEITFEGDIGDSVNADNDNVAAPFFIENVTHGDTMDFLVFDQDGDNEWDREEPILIMPYEGMITPYMFVVFDPYTNVTTIIDLGDTTVIDTAFDEIEDIEKGDVFRITINIPFAEDDKYHFTTISSRISDSLAEDELQDIAVVPNPYVVAAAWEPRLTLESGRGERKLDFINLPSECTIKIFTLNGYLVNTIKHQSIYENGTYSWNMLSKDGLELAHGLYIYHVEAENIGEFTGKFALIK
ncbi:MAG: hypothetical protein QF847_06990 [Candidatus Marinimicrobia bacterium]|jgi:hypothetical protein|nr:hypothetical protein [Candidatus Neomarinimicrobiota bacterium]MDP6610771.1 hypothetical protein [Candidatus Neomarinimicrobiota bacterium]MDP6726978.1 hypothetical protein [Candidatus Neomarinimicrobiota bacterium]|tara:strand:+ start:3153 stop:6392 length:3240 start_codon:yes stop_codon:yes gene_type:complete